MPTAAKKGKTAADVRRSRQPKRPDQEQNFEQDPLDPRRWDHDLDPILDQYRGSARQVITNIMKDWLNENKNPDGTYSWEIALFTEQDKLTRPKAWQVIRWPDLPKDIREQCNFVDLRGACAWHGLYEGLPYLVCAMPTRALLKLREARHGITSQRLSPPPPEETGGDSEWNVEEETTTRQHLPPDVAAEVNATTGAESGE